MATAEAVSSDIVNFTLRDLTVKVGTTVTWTNMDDVPHTTTAGTAPDPSGEWDSSTLQQGESYPFTFNEVGTFPYFCTVHPNTMMATVTVVEASAQPGGDQMATPSPGYTPVTGGGYEY